VKVSYCMCVIISRLRISQLRLMIAGMCRRIDWEMITDVSEKPIAFILRLQELGYIKDRDRLRRNVDNDLQAVTSQKTLIFISCSCLGRPLQMRLDHNLIQTST
jgi:hypothetical protein